jgi:hypothetical protein
LNRLLFKEKLLLGNILKQEKIKIEDKEIDVIELIYFDGPKMYLSLNEKLLLVWNNEKNIKETWFVIKYETDKLELYAERKITLLELIKQSKLKVCERLFKEYDKLKIIEKEPNLTNYILPTKNSYIIENLIDMNILKNKE